MKKNILMTGFVTALFSALLFNGCITDAFNTLIQNVPISSKVNITSNQSSASAAGTINLDNSSIYQSYKDKIKSITFAAGTFTADSVYPSTLQGDIVVSLSNASGQVIFSKTFTSVKPYEFIGDANKFNLQLTDAEKAVLNTQLNAGSKIFTGTVEVKNLSGYTTSYTIIGHYDVALTLEVNT